MATYFHKTILLYLLYIEFLEICVTFIVDEPNKDVFSSLYSSLKLTQFETDVDKNIGKVKHINDQTDLQQLNSPSGKWSVEKITVEDSPKVNDELSNVKKCLFKEKTIAEEIRGS